MTTPEPSTTPDPVAVQPEDPAGIPAPDDAGKEAARYRVRARDAEAQRDALSAQVLALQRREAERLAGERLSVAGDLWDVAQAQLADLLGEDGTVDPDRVTAAVDALVRSRPGLDRNAVRQVRPDLSQGARGGREPSEPGQAWADALAGR